jgi:hypothetical protein
VAIYIIALGNHRGKPTEVIVISHLRARLNL